jgi:staphylococcal nuclease domain-containing protein 1
VQPQLKQGQMCLAQYSLDKQWYRGYVERVLGLAGQYEVFFIDFGNRLVARVMVYCIGD